MRGSDKQHRVIWFDTEFIEDGKTIDLLSIGAVRADGAMFYAECEEADHSKASEWVKLNVLPKLLGGPARQPRRWIAESFKKFCGDEPEFWAYYADYDWVALCQLYGTMMDLPNGWPMFCRDVKQLCVSLGNPKLPEQDGAHHALADAKWTRKAWEFLSAPSHVRPTRPTCTLPEFIGKTEGYVGNEHHHAEVRKHWDSLVEEYSTTEFRNTYNEGGAVWNDAVNLACGIKRYLVAPSATLTRTDAMQEAAAYCFDCAEVSQRCGATALAAAQREMGENLKRRATTDGGVE